MSDTDNVLIIGGGPAGLAAALALRKRGMPVTVADSFAPPIDKPCGEGLMPDGVAALADIGVRLPPTEGFAFRGIRFVCGSQSVAAAFPIGRALGARRTVLHHAMVKQAERVGVQFLWKSVVTSLTRDGAIVNGALFRARWVVGADGSASSVRRWAGLDRHLHKNRRFAYRRHYRIAPWSDFMELHWGPGCQLYVTPVGKDEVCVVLISRSPSLRLDQALCAFPEVQQRLQNCEISTMERGAETVTRKLEKVCVGNVALIGDASGGVDAITGEGLCLAFKQAEALANSFEAADLRIYEAAHRRLAIRPANMARLMLLLENRDWLRDRAMRTFSRRPQIFAGMLATHVGNATALDITTNGLALGWRLLTA